MGALDETNRSNERVTPGQGYETTRSVRSPGVSDEQGGPATAPNIAAKGVVVGGMTLGSRISGLVRDVVLSHVLGASVAADTFFLVFRVPNFFRRLCAEGAFSQAFVPVLVSYRANATRSGDVRAMRGFVSAVAGNLGVVLLAATAVGVLGAAAVAPVFMAGFLRDPAQFALAVDLLRIVFPYAACISLVALAAGVLNVHNRYAVPAFTPLVLNMGLIGAALAAAMFADGSSSAAYYLAWGVLAAGIAQVALQAPALGRVGMLVTPRPDWSHEGARQVGRLFVPAALAASAGQVNALVGSQLAALLASGSVSWLYYADRLMELPVGIVAIAIGTVLLPSLSASHEARDGATFNATLDWGLRAGLLIGIPATVALAVLAYPLAATIYLHGETTPSDVERIVVALHAFTVGLIALLLVKIAAPAYFARQDTKTPMRFGVVSVVVNIGVGLATFQWLGHVGLALATSVAAIVNAWLLLRGLVRGGHYRPGARLQRSVLIAVVASGVMAVAFWWLVPDAAWWQQVPLWTRIGALTATVAGGFCVYAGTAFALGVRVRDFLHRA